MLPYRGRLSVIRAWSTKQLVWCSIMGSYNYKHYHDHLPKPAILAPVDVRPLAMSSSYLAQEAVSTTDVFCQIAPEIN